MIEHKGYSGLMEVNVEDGVISGRVLGIRDVISFEGDTVADAEQAFRDSVDDYLEFCSQRGVRPEKPFSGKFILRIAPDLHRALSVEAEARRLSLNALVERVLSRHLSVETSGSQSSGTRTETSRRTSLTEKSTRPRSFAVGESPSGEAIPSGETQPAATRRGRRPARKPR